ncbi:hypothetical protein EVA_11682, partial [gut metagenome]
MVKSILLSLTLQPTHWHLDKEAAHESDNKRLLQQLSQHFYLADCPLGCKPEEALQDCISQEVKPSLDKEKDGVLLVMMEHY